METLKYTKVREVKSPIRGTSVAAGIDFFVPTSIDKETFESKCKTTGCSLRCEYNSNNVLTKIELQPGESAMIPSGIKMKVPHGHALVFMNKSGVGAKKQLDVLACVIDEDYEGEVHINLVNTGAKVQIIEAGDKIVQGLILPINYAMPEEIGTVEELYAGSDSSRGEGGFGSTGTK